MPMGALEIDTRESARGCLFGHQEVTNRTRHGAILDPPKVAQRPGQAMDSEGGLCNADCNVDSKLSMGLTLKFREELDAKSDIVRMRICGFSSYSYRAGRDANGPLGKWHTRIRTQSHNSGHFAR